MAAERSTHPTTQQLRSLQLQATPLPLPWFTMPLLLFVFTVFTLHAAAPANSATTDTISAAQPLAGGEKLVSGNGRGALGFFETGSDSNWYMGIWFNTVPKLTPAWVANRDDPIKNITSLELTISGDGNLVILNRSSSSIIWSSQARATATDTIAVLLNTGNLVLQNSSSNPSDVFWQSFDYPTDTFLPGAKLGYDKVTGLNRRLVSWKNLIDPATGAYHEELDPSGLDQFLLTPLNSSTPYWYSGVWNGQYFALMPEMSNGYFMNFTFVDNDQEKYFMYTLHDETTVIRNYVDVSGQAKTNMWQESSQNWVPMFAQPKAQCDVYAVCGPSTICDDNTLPSCNCMKGFAVRSPKDWKLYDLTSGCLRNTPLDCSNRSTISTDRFYPMPCVRLPQNDDHSKPAAASSGECAQICLGDCSCTAYSFVKGECSAWHGELLDWRQHQCSDSSSTNGETLYLRLAAKEFPSQQASRRGKTNVILVISATVASLGLLAALVLLIIIWRNRTKLSGGTLKIAKGVNGIIAFRYADLQRATKSFSEKLGGGSFGSVFKGSLGDSTTIAVKRLDHANQGEKQFRAEVSSIGIIHHINLVRLIGFCCEGGRRLLVYEHMPNRSLDLHLFQSNATMPWHARYQIALGVARGLAYLHDSCQDCIIHCDIKPENILLDASFAPKIADFGMAKLLGRDFSRVLTTVRGTAGYLAPEWISGVAVTTKIDVYSYGMVLLEIISGRRNSWAPCSCGGDHGVYFPVNVAQKLLEGSDIGSLVDHMLHGDVNLDEAATACKVACWCIQDDEFDRPTMGEVVQILEGLSEISVPPMPRVLQAMSGRGSSHSTCS
uniref:Receptor-like serine/threonine-protein kinase n=1 Tax=Aegilops tauschii TaxID=37682 RepID=M8AXL9_AEGTA